MNKTTRALTESAILTVIACVAGLIVFYIPILRMLMFFVPMPLIIVARRHGVKYVVLSLASAFLLMMMASSPVYALLYILLPGIPAIAIGICMNLKQSVSTTLGSGILAALTAIIATFALLQYVTGIPVQEVMQKVFDLSASMSGAMANIPGADKSAVEQMIKQMNEASEVALLIVPAVTILMACLFTFLNYLFAAKILKRLGDPVEPLKPFREFKLPRNAIFGIALILILTVIAGRAGVIDERMLTTNVLALVEIAFCIQACAVMVYLMHYYKVHMAVRVIIFFIALSGPATILLMMAGMLDVILDFRKRLEMRPQK